MNILVIPNKGEKFGDKSNLFSEHLLKWSSMNNDVYLLSTSESVPVNGFTIIDKPKYSINNLILSAWYHFVNHPRIDLVIQSFSYFPFIIPKSNNVVYLNGIPKNKKIAKLLFKYVYNKCFFLVQNNLERNYLLDNKIKAQKVFLLERSFTGSSKKIKRNASFQKKLLYIQNKDSTDSLSEVLKVFERIDRRQEGWKYRLVVSKENYHITKGAVSELETPENFTVVQRKSNKTISLELAKTGILVDTENSIDSMQNDMKAIYSGVTVFSYRGKSNTEFPGVEKVMLYPAKNEPQEMANLIMDFSTNLALERKIQLNSETFLSQYSWDNLAKRSLGFLESI